MEEALIGEGSVGIEHHWWKHLWKLKVPPKVRIFWWRVIRKFLPTKAKLHRRHIEQLAACPTCRAANESIYLVITECTFACLFWNEIKEITGKKLERA